MTEPVFVDTNVWVYTVDTADPDKRARALAAVAPTSNRAIVISTQVLTEFYAVVTRKLRVPVLAAVAETMVARLAAQAVVSIDAPLVAVAVAGSRVWGIAIWDALIIAAAEAAGCRRLLSEDLAPGRTYGSVTVENPFRALSP